MPNVWPIRQGGEDENVRIITHDTFHRYNIYYVLYTLITSRVLAVIIDSVKHAVFKAEVSAHGCMF